VKLGFVGGTGIEGRGLALRFAAAGAEVLIGSRSPERAVKVAAEYNAVLGAESVRGLENSAVVTSADIVFLTVPFDQAPDAVRSILSTVRPGQVLVDVTVPLSFQSGKIEYVEFPEGSSAERIASILPQEVKLVGAFKELPAHVLGDLGIVLDCDVLVCGNSSEARDKVMSAIRLIPTLRPVDAGPLSSARVIERMTLLAVLLNRRYKKKGARFRIQGI
jgi:8-hydroxy-5-deazaflavin:NADPH oxidoreductase